MKAAVNGVNLLPLTHVGAGHLGLRYCRQNACSDFFTGCDGALSLRIVFLMAEKRFLSTWLSPVRKYGRCSSPTMLRAALLSSEHMELHARSCFKHQHLPVSPSSNPPFCYFGFHSSRERPAHVPMWESLLVNGGNNSSVHAARTEASPCLQ